MIFLVGQHCAGKSRISLIFAQAHFLCVDLGPLLREIHQQTAPFLPFIDWVRMGEEAEGRFFTDARLAAEVLRRIGNDSPKHWQDMLIVGNRSLEGVMYLIEKIGVYRGRKNIIVWVEAPVETLYRRYGVRNPDCPLSYSDFLDLLEVDNKIGLSALRNAAEVQLSNTGSEPQLEWLVRTLIRRLGYYTPALDT